MFNKYSYIFAGFVRRLREYDSQHNTRFSYYLEGLDTRTYRAIVKLLQESIESEQEKEEEKDK